MTLGKCILFGLLLFPVAQAQFVQQGSKLVGSSSGIGCQGISAALSADGNTAVVGGNCDTAGTGAAWVYTRTNGVWSQQGPKLVGSGAVGAANQGYSVSLSADGNTAIIGGPTDSVSGAAWIFVRMNGVWGQQAKLTGAGAVGGPNLGHSVALSGDGNTAIVGGPSDNNSAGAAWVFTRSNGVWMQQSKLYGMGVAGGSPVRQGTSVALSYDGGIAAVGGPFDNLGAGAIWIFVRSGAIWIQQAKIAEMSINSALTRQLGTSVAISADGNTVIGGAPGENSGGAAVVYSRQNGFWPSQGALLVGGGTVGAAGQGRSVALSADAVTALVGGPADNSLSGAAWVFSRASGSWQPQGNKLVGSGAAGVPSQAASVALSGDATTALVGGPGDNNSVGAAWAFARTGIYLRVDAPTAAFVGVSFPFVVTARNPDGSFATGYTGMVHFASTDPNAVLPPDSLLVNGTGAFSAIFRSVAGPNQTHTVTATDTTNPAIGGSSAPIVVQTTGFARLVLSVPATVTAGTPFRFNITTLDQFGNFVPVTNLRLRFTSTDGSAILPPETQGLAPFAAVLKTAGPQTITVVDLNSAAVGTSDPILVSTASATNLAPGKAATQSSTLAGYPMAGAASAIDANHDGNFFNGSVTATNYSTNPWWQVDLGASYPVTSVVLWNRTDCCAERLTDYWVFISDTPFSATDTPSILQGRIGTWSSHQTGAVGRMATIAAGTRGRYLRVQLSGTDYLSLAEVEVLSSPVADWNLAAGKAAAQSSTIMVTHRRRRAARWTGTPAATSSMAP